ncbi:cobalamin-binding protein [Colwellia psychrerythraea]|uniref:ABC-type transporter, periplasmic subunit n=1 Tax=Colwellia psychrerythraea TaxID=28229 RepID=A0A099KPE3_COLPS|nr:cobalamin-binding protein [Colwellia psychrerythraea]KGJ91797.1 ABC-type transporter, periplasmic subunit [Colwellia psychrerythraea]
MKFTSLLFTLLLISSSAYAIPIKESNEEAKIEASKDISKPSIIALAPHIVEMLYDIGAGEQIIGTTAFADYPEQAKKIPRIGNYVRLQLERVIELQPDLIVAWKSGNPSDDLARLEQLGFNIVYSQPNTFEDIAKEVRSFAKLTGHSAQGEQVAKKFEQELAQIKQRYQNKTKITGFYELWSRPLTTVAKGSWPQQFLNICQVKNPFERVITPYPQISIEQVLPASVQLIIQPLSINQKEREGFNWQDWTIIPAVANKQIIQPDADAMHRMSIRSLTALKDLCAAIDKTRTILQQKNN